MKSTKLVVMCLALIMLVAGAANVFGHERKTDKIVEILKSKGIISDQDAASVSAESNWFENMVIGGAVELQGQYLTDRDRSDPNTDSTSELYVATVELGIEAKVNDQTTATLVMLAEDIGHSDDTGDNEKIACDEATFTIESMWNSPIYLVAGKRALPFGQFYTHTISDPLPHGAYEINKASLTLGAAVEKAAGLDASLTLYKGEDMMDAVTAIGSAPGRHGSHTDATDDVNSFIVSVSLAPAEGISFGAAYASESGYDKRNSSVDLFTELVLGKFTLDAEYIAATERESFTGGQTFKENTFAVGAALQITDPLEVAIRYEEFDNDRSTQAQGDIDYNIVAGVNWGWMENSDLMFEVRSLNEHAGGVSTYEETIQEVNVLLAAGF